MERGTDLIPLSMYCCYHWILGVRGRQEGCLGSKGGRWVGGAQTYLIFLAQILIELENMWA